MPKYYCEYCDINLTHSSPAGRRQHNNGRKHINNKIEYYQNLIRDPNFVPPAHVTDAALRAPAFAGAFFPARPPVVLGLGTGAAMPGGFGGMPRPTFAFNPPTIRSVAAPVVLPVRPGLGAPGAPSIQHVRR